MRKCSRRNLRNIQTMIQDKTGVVIIPERTCNYRRVAATAVIVLVDSQFSGSGACDRLDKGENGEPSFSGGSPGNERYGTGAAYGSGQVFKGVFSQ